MFAPCMRLMSILHYFTERRSNAPVDTTPAAGISLPRYMGRWYEHARFENWFEAGLDTVYTDYRLRSDGQVEVLNCGTNTKGWRKLSKGRGICRCTGSLRVSFVPPYFWFRAPYNILYVDPEYQSALVSGDGSNFLWLLTRKAQPPQELVATLLNHARLRGFNTEQLRYTKQE